MTWTAPIAVETPVALEATAYVSAPAIGRVATDAARPAPAPVAARGR